MALEILRKFMAANFQVWAVSRSPLAPLPPLSFPVDAEGAPIEVPQHSSEVAFRLVGHFRF